MNRAQRRAAARGTSTALMVLPNAGPPDWTQDADGRVTAVRQAEFWRKLSRRRVACDLCYRACELAIGEQGWCGVRANRGGRLEPTAHGVITTAMPFIHHFFYWRNHARALWLGGSSCTSRCSFCTSTKIAWAPEQLAWGYGERRIGNTGGWAYHRAMLHPRGAIALAKRHDCSGLYFGINEPLLSYEWTLDTARLARAAGLFTHVDTNGFSGAEPVRELAPWMDMAYVGLKGHLDDAFYARHMRSAGAVPAVKAALLAWRDSPAILGLSDVIPPEHWLSDADAEEQQRRLYSWIAEELGPLTPLEIRTMIKPAFGYGEVFEHLTPHGSGDLGTVAAMARLGRALDIAKECGLEYVYSHATRAVRCHACGKVLIGKIGWIRFEKHVGPDGRCGHCGILTPIIGISDQEYQAVQDEERAGSLPGGG